MKTTPKQSILNFINALLSLKGWHDISEPVLFQGEFSFCSKELRGYFNDDETLQNILENEHYKLLLETLLSFELAIEDD